MDGCDTLVRQRIDRKSETVLVFLTAAEKRAVAREANARGLKYGQLLRALKGEAELADVVAKWSARHCGCLTGVPER